MVVDDREVVGLAALEQFRRGVEALGIIEQEFGQVDGGKRPDEARSSAAAGRRDQLGRSVVSRMQSLRHHRGRLDLDLGRAFDQAR